MPTKKTTAKKSPYKPLKFNKKNAIELGKDFFSEGKNGIQFTRLCQGDLKAGNLHCAIGEAYFRFVDNRVNKVVTEDAIASLVQTATGKTTNDDNVFEDDNALKLKEALESCVEANDEDGEIAYELDSPFLLSALRAERVRRIWMDEVVPLLK